MVRVAHIQRKPDMGHHSIEGLFEVIRDHMPEGLKVEKVEVPRLSQGLRDRLQIVKFCQQLDYDVLHITGDIHFAASGLSRLKSILTIHDCEILYRLSGLKRWIVKRYWFMRPLADVGWITTISKASLNDLSRHTGIRSEHVRVIPNPVSPAFQPSPQCFSEVKPRVLQIGTKHNKNVIRLAEALRGISCHLRIIGQLKPDQIRSLETNRIEYTTVSGITEGEMVHEYEACDLVTLVSTKEGFGMPIIEGQAVERVVLTSKCSSMPEVAGKGALLVDPLNVQSIREGIQRLIEDRELRKELIGEGKQNRKRFGAKRIAELYAELYLKVYEKNYR